MVAAEGRARSCIGEETSAGRASPACQVGFFSQPHSRPATALDADSRVRLPALRMYDSVRQPMIASRGATRSSHTSLVGRTRSAARTAIKVKRSNERLWLGWVVAALDRDNRS